MICSTVLVMLELSALHVSYGSWFITVSRVQYLMKKYPIQHKFTYQTPHLVQLLYSRAATFLGGFHQTQLKYVNDRL